MRNCRIHPVNKKSFRVWPQLLKHTNDAFI